MVASINYKYTAKSTRKDNCESGKNYYCFQTTVQCFEGSGRDGGSGEDNGSSNGKASGYGSGEDDEGSGNDNSGDDDDDSIIVITPKPATKPRKGRGQKRIIYTAATAATTAATVTTATTMATTTEDVVTDSPLTFEETKAELLRNFSEV